MENNNIEEQITRSYLYFVAARYLEDYKNDDKEIRLAYKLFYDAYMLTKYFEDKLEDFRQYKTVKHDMNFYGDMEYFASKDRNNIYLRELNHNILFDKENKNDYVQSYKNLLKGIIKYQKANINFDKIVNNIKQDEQEIKKRPKTFLSYAYLDKGLTIGLFLYFWLNGGFLFVDWMWTKKSKSAIDIKENISEHMKYCVQFLLLKTINSELLPYGKTGSLQIRQWCAWEMGHFYSPFSKDNKFYVSFYRYASTSTNTFTDNLKPMCYIKDGFINK